TPCTHTPTHACACTHTQCIHNTIMRTKHTHLFAHTHHAHTPCAHHAHTMHIHHAHTMHTHHAHTPCTHTMHTHRFSEASTPSYSRLHTASMFLRTARSTGTSRDMPCMIKTMQFHIACYTFLHAA